MKYKKRRHKRYVARSKISPMARRSYRRYSAPLRRFRRSGRRGGIGGFKGMLSPILGGIADSYLDPMLPIDGVGATAVGMFMHNTTIKDLGLYKVGMSIGNIIPLPGRTQTSTGVLL